MQMDRIEPVKLSGETRAQPQAGRRGILDAHR
jgi:hypothetical protein